MAEPSHYDLVVIGGGPAGSTLATLVAMQGRRVLLLEREKFPRYQIGESLLPSTILGICTLLGVEKEVEEAGFTEKDGGTLKWGKSPEPWTFSFRNTPLLNGKVARGYAYQVERSKFDDILLQNARKKGVEVLEEHTVKGVIEENGRVVGVRYLDKSGTEHRVSSRFVANAAGNVSTLHHGVGERIWSKFFRNLAIFGYWKREAHGSEGGQHLRRRLQERLVLVHPADHVDRAHERRCRAPGGGVRSDQGGRRGEGLPREHRRVPAHRQPARGRRAGHGRHVRRSADPEGLVVSPEHLLEARNLPRGRHGGLRRPSPLERRPPRHVLVLLAARSINSVLINGMDEEKCFAEYEKRYRKEYGIFYDFLISFYDMHRDESSYFWEARKVLNTKKKDNEQFVRLVAGVSSPQEFFRNREGMSDKIQAVNLGEPNAPKMDAIIHGFHEVRSELIDQALVGDMAHKEQPMFEGGMITSKDGMFWAEPA